MPWIIPAFSLKYFDYNPHFPYNPDGLCRFVEAELNLPEGHVEFVDTNARSRSSTALDVELRIDTDHQAGDLDFIQAAKYIYWFLFGLSEITTPNATIGVWLRWIGGGIFINAENVDDPPS